MKILVGYDGSKVSDNAVQLARKHVQAFKANLHIITSLKQGPDLKKEDIDKAESKLERLKALFKADGLPCETQVVVSVLSTGEDLVRFVKENNSDEIIIGVRRKSKVGKLVFGSTAQYVILEAPCTVVAVK